MTEEELAKQIIEDVGGVKNIASAFNCMTRVRIFVHDDSAVQDDALGALDGVLAVVHNQKNYLEVVVGPGKCRKCIEAFRAIGIPSNSGGSEKAAAPFHAQASSDQPDSVSDQAPSDRSDTASDQAPSDQQVSVPGQSPSDQQNTVPDQAASAQTAPVREKKYSIKGLLKTFGHIFTPLIPGVIVAGIFAGVASLISQAVPDYADHRVILVIYNLLTGVNTALITYLTAWVGYRAAELFGGTPILGGMLGMFTMLGNVDPKLSRFF